MKKIIAMLLAMMMVFAAFGAMAEAVDPTTIDDTMTAENGVYEVAMVTDVGQLKDGSFNEGTWNGVKLFASANGMSYKYYQPANGNQATDDDRIDAMKFACDNGAKIVVAPGFMQATAMTTVATEYPEVKFIFIDGWDLELDNVAAIAYAEQESGYMAGYAIVKDGFEKIGFMGGGGGTNPACCRYGYGFAQGVSAAAKELGKTVELKYTWQYGASFSASPELQTMASGWYETGTEVIFACGGTMFDSIAAAAAANDAFVVGVDVDQSNLSETVVTSALKDLPNSVQWALNKFLNNEWDAIGNNCTTLGAKDNSTGLPTANWLFETYTVEEYQAQFEAIKAGTLVPDASAPLEGEIVNTGLENVTILYE